MVLDLGTLILGVNERRRVRFARLDSLASKMSIFV